MRVAYRDEFPWARCDCGWRIHNEDYDECPGCKKREIPVRRDRFHPFHEEVTHDVTGHRYLAVPYEDLFKHVPR